MPRTELRAAPPDESIIKLPELKEERKTIGKEAFKEKYLYKPTFFADEEMVKMIRSKELVSFVEKEISNEEKWKEGRVFHGGHEKVPAEEWIRKGLSFNRGPGLPAEEATTFEENALQTAGWTMGVVLLQHIANPIIGGILSKVPGAAQPIAKLTTQVAKHPWKVG